MYRADRFAHNRRSTRRPLEFTACAATLFIIAIACGVGRDTTTSDTAAATPTPQTQAQPMVAGEVTDSAHGTPQPVTFASADAEYAGRHYREAAESFTTYVEQHPDNPFGHYMLGLSAWKSGDLQRARDAFEQSLALDSTNVKTLLNLSRVLLDQGYPDDAMAHVGAAIAVDSELAEPHRMMGRVQVALKQPDSAVASYRLALALDPADSWSMNNLGLLLIEQGRYEEALPPLARAVEIRPEAPAFANNLGVALERTGHPAAAAEAYRTALANDSTYTKASRSLARVVGTLTDSTLADTVDLAALAASFNQEIQTERESRRLARAIVKPDTVPPPER